ncbi:MAG: aminotransferase, partial [Clostridia bacterium]|nr:aminotransferase [Clostridia bacterium]
MNYLQASKEALLAERASLRKEYEAVLAEGLSLDLSRGKPSAEQLDLSMPMLSAKTVADCKSADGFDCRNYGLGTGLPEMKAFWSELTGIPAENILVGGNSSLNLMYDAVMRCMLLG